MSRAALYPKPRRSQVKRWRKLRRLGIALPRPARNLDGSALVRLSKGTAKMLLLRHAGVRAEAFAKARGEVKP